jgi:hypothetical protein
MIGRMARAHGHSVDDYLEAIYFLVSPIDTLPFASIADKAASGLIVRLCAT